MKYDTHITTIIVVLTMFLTLVWAQGCMDDMKDLETKPDNPNLAECWEAHQRIKDLGIECHGDENMCLCGKEY